MQIIFKLIFNQTFLTTAFRKIDQLKYKEASEAYNKRILELWALMQMIILVMKSIDQIIEHHSHQVINLKNIGNNTNLINHLTQIHIAITTIHPVILIIPLVIVIIITHHMVYPLIITTLMTTKLSQLK